MVSNSHPFQSINPAAETRAAACSFATKTVANPRAAICSHGEPHPRSFISRVLSSLDREDNASSGTEKAKISFARVVSLAGGTRTRSLLGNRTPCRASMASCCPVDRRLSITCLRLFPTVRNHFGLRTTRENHSRCTYTYPRYIYHVCNFSKRYRPYAPRRAGVGEREGER